MAVSTPPRTSPISVPITMETWLIPSAFPRSFSGNASVIIAPLLEKRKAEPTPWRSLNAMSCSPDLGEARESGGHGEEREPEGVEPHPPEHVREAAEVHQERAVDELVPEEDPEEVEEGGAAELPRDGREGDEDDVGVEGRHQGPEGGVGKDDPLVLQSLLHRAPLSSSRPGRAVLTDSDARSPVD